MAAPAAAPKPAPRPVSRIETAYTATRPPGSKLPPVAAAAPAAPTAPSAPRPAAAKPAEPAARPAAPSEPESEDVLRQTQTMRAIASAKSIDDISEIDAETLFGDAGLDLVSAALASAAEWPDDDVGSVAPPATPATPPAPAKSAAPKEPPAEPVDDPFDLFGLGDDAPLELIDDSAQPRKAGSR
jgi:hypothetical protein